MKLLVAVGFVLSLHSTSVLSASRDRWCCMLEDKVASFESKGRKRNICLKSVEAPVNEKSAYVKKCKSLAGSWLKQDKKKRG